MVKDRKRRLKTQRDPNIFPNGPEIPMFFFVPRCPTTPTSFILTVSFWGLWIKRNTMWCTSSWLFLAGIGPCSFIGLFVALLALDSPSPLSWSAATKSRFMVMVSLLFCLAVLIKIHEAPDLFGVYVGWQVRSRILPELYWFEWCLLFLSASSVTPKEWVWYLLFWQLLQNNFFQNVSKAWGKDITFKISMHTYMIHMCFQWTCPHLQAWPWRMVQSSQFRLLRLVQWGVQTKLSYMGATKMGAGRNGVNVVNGVWV